jgi:tRNA G18 (ribose-2'-O)-methylase SpoU
MPVVHLESLDDPRIVEYRALSDPELARSRGWFVVEGRLVLRRLLEDGHFGIRSVLLSPAARRAVEPLLDRLGSELPVYVCRARDFLNITGFNIHRGCLALVERPADRSIRGVLHGARTVVALEAVANADNIGGVFRNAAAFGVDAVLLSPTCCDPLYRKAIRTSMAATLRVPFARFEQWPQGLASLRDQGFTIAALTARHGAQPLEAFAAAKRPDRLALLVGAEGTGLSDEAISFADTEVHIPIRPDVDSLNLAVAAGIALSRLVPPNPS